MTAAFSSRRWVATAMLAALTLPALAQTQAPAPAAAQAASAPARKAGDMAQRYQERMLAALQTRDRCALRATQQEVLRSAYAAKTPPALRQALRLLVWHMAACLPLRQDLYETGL